MQIYALDSDASLVFADKANKHQDYHCIECQQIIRLRRGIHRKAHYYHLQPNRTCRLNAKGMPHLMLQLYIKSKLPEGEVDVECRFPSIGRIADVAWHPRRLIYEIQCSPITAEEIKARNASYAAIGYQVVWIFHDERYNQARVSAAEDYLSDKPHYYSNMNADGEGVIYDQFAAVVNGRRVQRLPVLPIDVSSPRFLNLETAVQDELFLQLPFVLRQKIKRHPLVFFGDTIERLLQPQENPKCQNELRDQIEKLVPYENKLTLLFILKNKKLFFKRWVAKPYQSLLKLFLERACR